MLENKTNTREALLKRVRAAVQAPAEVEGEDALIAFLAGLHQEEGSRTAHRDDLLVERLKRHVDYADALGVDRATPHDELVALVRQRCGR